MNINCHFKNLTLTSDQQSALSEISDFLINKNQIFILQGYAGTGKTTLIKGVADYLSANKKKFRGNCANWKSCQSIER